MEREMQHQSPTTIKEFQRNVGNARTSDSGNPASESKDLVNVGSSGVLRDHIREGQNNPSENSELQLVLFNPTVTGSQKTRNTPSLDVGQTQSPGQRAFSNHRPRGSPQYLAFAVQCANCFKWRLVPSMEKYEEIREHILEKPFFCETGREWRPDISCNEPADIMQDDTRLWAIDKPSIARAPVNWKRKLRLRAKGGTKFADVYYVSPTGKRLRSLTDIERFFAEHPEYMTEGVSLDKFSFQLPRPLQQNYVKRRGARPSASPFVPFEGDMQC